MSDISHQTEPRASADHRAWPIAVNGDAVTAWVLAFAPVFYLALENGGYDTVVSGQVGVLAWWGLLLAAVAGLMPRLRLAGYVAVVLLATMAVWTAIGIGGSESQERTLAETGRLAGYVGVLLVALAVQARAGSRHLINGLATAIGAITILAVLSRLHPQWFPANDQVEFLPSASRRLSYPLNYWNALAALMAIGAVLLLAVSATARTRIGQAASAAMLPLACLGVYLCVSRAGAIVFVFGLVVYLVLVDDRLPKLVTILVGAAGGALLIVRASALPAVQTGVDSAAARSEGAEMIWLTLLVCFVVGVLSVGINHAARHASRPPWMRPSRRQTWIAAAATLPVLLAAMALGGAGGELADRWDSFKTPPAIAGSVTDTNVFARLQDSAGQGRYQYWESALDAYKSDKLTGIGAATFGLWWSRNAIVGGAVQDAHNLYVQTLAELGLPGALLLLGFVGLTIFMGLRGTMRTRGQERVLLAAATAGLLVFWLDASVEWIWQIAVMPAAMLMLAAVVLGQRVPSAALRKRIPRLALALAALAAVWPIILSSGVASNISESQQAAGRGDLAPALAAAQRAARLQPGASSPRLQEALVLEQHGDVRAALTLAVKATALEPTNWKPWVIRARLEARLGHTKEALAAFRTARRLNPESDLLFG